MGRRGHDEDHVSDEGQRRCQRGEWCRSYTVELEDGQPVRRPAPTPRPFCDADRGDIARCLAEMPRQYLCLGAELGRPARGGHAIRVPFGPRLPLRADADALMRLITECLYCWHERVADVARLDFPSARMSRLRRDGPAVKRAADVLGAHLDALIALERQPVVRALDLRALAALPDDTSGIVHAAFASVLLDLDGADAGNEILHLHYLSRAVLGETRARPEELAGVPCRADGCGLRALVRAEPPSDPRDPGNWSQCLVCGDTMADGEYAEWTALCAAYERSRSRVPATLENLPVIA